MASKRSSEQVVRDALVALWTDRRSDKHGELYAEALQALESSATDSESPTPLDTRPLLEALIDECEDFLLWEPRKRGFAAAHHRFATYVWTVRGVVGSDEWKPQETC